MLAFMAAWSRNSPAALADSAHPSTGTPLACQASRAASSANVLPVPAGARTTSTPRSPRVTASTSARCSAEIDGRLSNAVVSAFSVTVGRVGRYRCACSIAVRSSGNNSRVL